MALSVLTIACSNKKKSTDYYPANQRLIDVPKTLKSGEIVLFDEEKYLGIEEKPVGTTNISTNRPHITKDKELDNMRGFDPASEDDMDDNGMQRYFDANDDEAWD